MIGYLPKSLKVNNVDRVIRTDYRVALLILQAYEDIELSEQSKIIIILDSLYVDFKDIKQEEYEEALVQASWYLDGGKEYETFKNNKKIIDWEQDEQIIFSAVNKVAYKEVRELEYMHWWTFLGYFSEIGEGMLSTIINIRNKINKGKKLEKYEQEFYRGNQDLIKIKVKLTREEEELNKLFS